jgi:hypothetical protein
MVVVRAPEMVRDVMFICLKMTARSIFLAKEDNKQGVGDVSLVFFIKNE